MMDSMEPNDWVTAAIAVAALVVSFLAWRSSHRSARAAEDSAVSARRTATVEEQLLDLERQDRAEVNLQRRMNVWHVQRFGAHSAQFEFVGAEAHHVSFEANVALQVDRMRGHMHSPMYKGDRMIVEAQDPDGWDRRVTVSWAESEGVEVERLSKLHVV